jgi:hypothetical protein
MTEEILARTEWLSIRKKNGWEYVTEEKATEGVSVLLYNSVEKTILIRNELIPPHSDIAKRTSLTGMVEADEGRRKAAIREVEEESGYYITENDLLPLNCIFPYKASSYRIWLYGCNTIGKNNRKHYKDAEGSVSWLSVLEALQVSDPLISTSIVRLHYFHGVGLLEGLIPLGVR